MMTEQVLRWLDDEVRRFPERATGNECEDYVVQLAGSIVESDRNALVAAMREWIERRDRQTLLGVRIAGEHELIELKPAVERLLEDVRAGRVFSPYYEELIVPALRHMDTLS